MTIKPYIRRCGDGVVMPHRWIVEWGTTDDRWSIWCRTKEDAQRELANLIN